MQRQMMSLWCHRSDQICTLFCGWISMVCLQLPTPRRSLYPERELGGLQTERQWKCHVTVPQHLDDIPACCWYQWCWWADILPFGIRAMQLSSSILVLKDMPYTLPKRGRQSGVCTCQHRCIMLQVKQMHVQVCLHQYYPGKRQTPRSLCPEVHISADFWSERNYQNCSKHHPGWGGQSYTQAAAETPAPIKEPEMQEKLMFRVDDMISKRLSSL